MSKFLNIFAPAFGGAALVAGIAYGVSTRDYRAQEADLAMERSQAAMQQAEAAVARIAEIEAQAQSAAATQEEELASLRDQLRSAQNAVKAAQAQAQAAAQSRPAMVVSTQGSDSTVTASTTAGLFGLGREALPEEVAAWNIDIMPDGTGLPVGSGDVWTGDEVFAEHCAVCHGDFAEGRDNWPKLAGGDGTLADKDPLKTVGSYWPYLSTTFDYVRRSMPFGNAQSLSDDDVYAITAYILYSNDLVDDDFVLSNETFMDVEMPNADGFILDDRDTAEAHFWTEPCMTDCKDSVEITMRAAVLDVTPEEEGGAEEAKEEASMDSGNDVATEEPATQEASAAAAPAIDMELASAGEGVFKKCKACHQVGDGAKNRTGPMLNGVVGAQIAHVDGFKYSSDMAALGEEGKVWTEEELSAFLEKPKGYLKKTKMSFAGLKKEEDRQAVIEYLKTFN